MLTHQEVASRSTSTSVRGHGSASGALSVRTRGRRGIRETATGGQPTIGVLAHLQEHQRMSKTNSQ